MTAPHPPGITADPAMDEPLSPDDFDEIDAILDDLRTRFDETPQWEFCEGFMAALICCRRLIMPSEYLPVLLDLGGPDEGQEGEGSFADDAQAQRFMALWVRRWNEVSSALEADVDTLDDDRAYQPEVLDVRGAVAAMPEAERLAMASEALPSFAQVWALGFMFAVETWPEEWAAPRDKEGAKWLNESLDAIVTLTEDDEDEPTISMFDEDGPPSLSAARLNDFAAAVWAVYDLRELWRNIGPRVPTLHRTDTPGRNDPCPCGSGKKYKKCHGAN
ncbi:MAG: UPF0149 family protein [Rhodoferax sp.]|nr:UPF0149 family protein [Rhodoferax sp.]